ncbi:unnamed protein product, partial [Prorocentrum cordatum]
VQQMQAQIDALLAQRAMLGMPMPTSPLLGVKQDDFEMKSEAGDDDAAAEALAGDLAQAVGPPAEEAAAPDDAAASEEESEVPAAQADPTQAPEASGSEDGGDDLPLVRAELAKEEDMFQRNQRELKQLRERQAELQRVLEMAEDTERRIKKKRADREQAARDRGASRMAASLEPVPVPKRSRVDEVLGRGRDAVSAELDAELASGPSSAAVTPVPRPSETPPSTPMKQPVDQKSALADISNAVAEKLRNDPSSLTEDTAGHNFVPRGLDTGAEQQAGEQGPHDEASTDELETMLEEMKGKRGAGDVDIRLAVAKQSYNFGMRSAIGNKLDRDLKANPAKALEWKQDKSQDKEYFKKKWPLEKWSELPTTKRTFTTTHAEDWRERGELMTFLKMAYEEGGPAGQTDPGTLEACMRTVKRCIDLGHPYAQRDPQNGVLKFLYFRLIYQESFKREWSKTIAQTKGPKAIENGSSGTAGGGGAADVVQKQLATAKKLTEAIKGALSAGKAMLDDIKEKAEFKWARTDEVEGLMDAKEQALRTAARSIALASMLMSNTELAQATD